MSFSRAVIKRFNESADTSIPPPGAYDPKFATDVAVIAKSSKCIDVVSARASRSRTRPEDNEPSQTAIRRKSRDRSLTVRRSFIPLPNRPASVSRESNYSLSANPNKISASISRLIRPRSLQNKKDEKIPTTVSGPVSWKLQKTPSASASSIPDNDVIATTAADNKVVESHDIEQPKAPPFPIVSRVESNHEIVEMYNNYSSNQCSNMIKEIQDLAEKLQVEASEYKRRLAEEEIRTNELNEKRHELEFTVQSLKRELQKYETAIPKEPVKEDVISNKEKLYMKELTKAKAALEKEMHDLRQKSKTWEVKEAAMITRVTKLEEEKSVWQKEKMEYEVALKQLRRVLKEKESQIEKSSEPCSEIQLSEIDTCSQHIKKEKVTDLEDTPPELNDVEAKELAHEKESLQKEVQEMVRKLEAANRFNDFVKTVQTGEVFQNFIR